MNRNFSRSWNCPALEGRNAIFLFLCWDWCNFFSLFLTSLWTVSFDLRILKKSPNSWIKQKRARKSSISCYLSPIIRTIVLYVIHQCIVLTSVKNASSAALTNDKSFEPRSMIDEALLWLDALLSFFFLSRLASVWLFSFLQRWTSNLITVLSIIAIQGAKFSYRGSIENLKFYEHFYFAAQQFHRMEIFLDFGVWIGVDSCFLFSKCHSVVSNGRRSFWNSLGRWRRGR